MRHGNINVNIKGQVPKIWIHVAPTFDVAPSHLLKYFLYDEALLKGPPKERFNYTLIKFI